MSAPPIQPTCRTLVIPFAQTGGTGQEAPPLAAWPQPLQSTLPHLHALLRESTAQTLYTGQITSRTPPHEWALALAQGRLSALPPRLPEDATLPWAAWEGAHLLPNPSAAAAWFMPAHLEVGMDHVSLVPPDSLDLDETTARQLLHALEPLAREDGIALHWVSAHRWLAVGAVFAELKLASPDRVASPSGERSIAPWMADLPPALRRLQTEAQMLFYTHPAHDKRMAQRKAPVNSLWLAGAGQAGGTTPPAQAVEVEGRLKAAALAGDAQAWLGAWRAVDAGTLNHWLARARRGEAVTVMLCGERHLLELRFGQQAESPSFIHRLMDIFGIQHKPDHNLVL